MKSKGKNNGTYIRVGSTNRKASFEIIEELERQKRKISFDSVTVYEKFDFDKSLKGFIRFFEKQSGLKMDLDHLKNIKVAMFDNMLEITSPGHLPDTMPIEKLGSGRSEIRNRVLAPIFKKLKLIESWGTGIQRMQDEVSMRIITKNSGKKQKNLRDISNLRQKLLPLSCK